MADYPNHRAPGPAPSNAYYQYPQQPLYPYRSTTASMNQAYSSPLQSSSQGTSQSAVVDYKCLYEPCASNRLEFNRKADLERHVAITHNRATIQLYDCQFAGCHRRGEHGFTRKDKMVDHMRDVHGAKIPMRSAGTSTNAT